ncbi:MAG: hypothetical protein D6732_24425 [Methanobacteriota archaeon]|nr:MAG: hypothetical protein D6732_24425 [Euryarchaeota archaeon]
MAKKELRSLAASKRSSIETKKVYNDSRTAWEAIKDFFKGDVETYSTASFVAGFIIIGCVLLILMAKYMFPHGDDESGTVLLSSVSTFLINLIFWVMTIVFILNIWKKPSWPFSAPVYDGGKGIFYASVGLQDDIPNIFEKDQLCTHALVFGTTGSGKTELLLSWVFNSMLVGSGVLYTDGKADEKFLVNAYTVMRRFSRDDDLLTMNFISGGTDFHIEKCMDYTPTNTANITALGGSSSLSELILGLMPETGGDSKFWSDRAAGFVNAISRVFVYLRETKMIAGRMKEFSKRMESVEELVKLCLDPRIPHTVKSALLDYVMTLGLSSEPFDEYFNALRKNDPTQDPYNKAWEAITKQIRMQPEIRKQHGFISMQVIRPLSLLSDDYGYIFARDHYDIDPFDVLTNRRCFLVPLPALDKSSESLESLGKLIIAMMKMTIASIMGRVSPSGHRADAEESSPSMSDEFFLSIMDEAGYYLSKGVAVLPAQARSFGIGFVFAGQDYPAFERLVKEEAESIVANSNIKICMKLEEVEKTFKVFKDIAGQEYAVVSDRVERGTFGKGGTDQAQITQVERLDMLDLKAFNAGEHVLVYKDDIRFSRGMYLWLPVDKGGIRKSDKYKYPKFVECLFPNEDVADVIVSSYANNIDRLKVDISGFVTEAKDRIPVHVIKNVENLSFGSLIIKLAEEYVSTSDSNAGQFMASIEDDEHLPEEAYVDRKRTIKSRSQYLQRMIQEKFSDIDDDDDEREHGLGARLSKKLDALDRDDDKSAEKTLREYPKKKITKKRAQSILDELMESDD